MNSLVLPETTQKVTDLIGTVWNGNRVFDRACSVAKVKFNMYNLEKVLHNDYAHYFPTVSDKIVEFMEGYNQSVIYPETIKGGDDYINPIDLIIQLTEYFGDFREKLYKLAKELTQYENTIDYELSKYLDKIGLETLEKYQRLIKIQNIITGALRPDSSKQEIIDLDNYVAW